MPQAIVLTELTTKTYKIDTARWVESMLWNPDAIWKHYDRTLTCFRYDLILGFEQFGATLVRGFDHLWNLIMSRYFVWAMIGNETQFCFKRVKGNQNTKWQEIESQRTNDWWTTLCNWPTIWTMCKSTRNTKTNWQEMETHTNQWPMGGTTLCN